MSSKPARRASRLPRQLKRLRDLLASRPYVHVLEIYRHQFGAPWPGDPRSCQQRLGPVIARYRKHKAAREDIVLGPEAYTYTLSKD